MALADLAANEPLNERATNNCGAAVAAAAAEEQQQISLPLSLSRRLRWASAWRLWASWNAPLWLVVPAARCPDAAAVGAAATTTKADCKAAVAALER